MPIPTLAEKLEWLKPAPATPYEKECAAKVPQGDYEIGVQVTNDILDEAMEVFVRSSRSYFGVSGDSMVAVFTANGDLINASCGTYLHAIIQPIIIKFIHKYYHENPGIKDGDIWYTNDALYGGIHNPDQVALMPIFHKGKLLAWGSAALHTTETGAIEPGGMPVSAKNRFEEGLNLPPIKIAENFEIRNDFLEMYSAYGMRAPAMFISDLRARCTTADRVRVRVLELAEKRGPEFVTGLFRKMSDTAEAGARKKIRDLPDGKFRAITFNDAIGMTPALVRSCYLTLTKKGEGIVFDFHGTSPENPSSYNVHPQAVVGHIANFMYEYMFHDLPICSSTFAPLDFVFPEGCIMYPDKMAATSCCVYIGMQARCATQNSFAKMIFSNHSLWRQVAAPPGSQHTSQICAGLSQWKLAYSDVLSFALNSMGQGGRAATDGMDSYGFAWCAFGRAPDSEQVESELPVTVTLSQHWKDSSGAGLHRGGSGGVQHWMVHKAPEVISMCMGNGSKVPLGQPLFRRVCILADSRHQHPPHRFAAADARRESATLARQPRHSREALRSWRLELRAGGADAQSVRGGRSALRIQRRRARIRRSARTRAQRSSRRSPQTDHLGVDCPKHLQDRVRCRASQARSREDQAASRRRAARAVGPWKILRRI